MHQASGAAPAQRTSRGICMQLHLLHRPLQQAQKLLALGSGQSSRGRADIHQRHQLRRQQQQPVVRAPARILQRSGAGAHAAQHLLRMLREQRQAGRGAACL